MTGTANAIVVCVDSSGFMLNEDYSPNRWIAQIQAVTWLVQELASSNTCTVVGIKGGRPSVLGSTSSGNSTPAALNPTLPLVPVSCGCSPRYPYALLPSLQLAQLLLRDRRGGRVIAFCGSPTNDSAHQLTSMATFYKDNDIFFDVVTFGDADVDMWDKIRNCRLSPCLPDGPSIEDTISLLRWDAHQEEPPLPTSNNIPAMRMPSPSRVCRRVVVDSTKVPAHSLSLSLSLMLSLSLPSPSGSPSSRDRVVLMVSLPPQRNKKILVEFRAGRCLPGGFYVRPMRKKGHLAVLQVHDHLLQFIWRDRVTGQIGLDVSVHSGEGTFQRVPLHVTRARVYYLHIFDSNRKYFFWMQHPDPSQDVPNCAVIYDFLAGPAPSHTHPTHLDPSDIQQLLSLYRGGSPSLGSSPPTSPASSSSPSASSSSLLPFDNARKWITNPAWNPPLSHHTPSHSLHRHHSLPDLDRNARPRVPACVSVPARASRIRCERAVRAGAAEPSIDLTQTLASPTAAAVAMPELGHLGTTPAPIRPPSPLAEQGTTPLEGVPPPSPPHDRQ